MSTINTNGINVNYPTPGVNNNSQGFRDNFASIRTNLNTAGSEITDLQNKVVVKQALNNSTLNNDMANTLISNASTRGFRATTFNLGNAISGTMLIDVSLADVQYGTIAGNTTLQFGGWAPTGTQSNVQLQLAVSDVDAVITFPSELATTDDSGATTLENYANVGGVVTVTVPYGVTQLDYRISTLDCGNTLTIEPFNRPRIDTQIQQRLVPPTGFMGDVPGTVAVGPSFNQLTISLSNAADYLTTSGNTTQLYTDLSLTFSGVSCEGNITIGNTYYVRNVVSSTTFTVSSSIGGSNINLAGNASVTSAMYANPISYVYVCTDPYDATEYTRGVASTTDAGNIITLDAPDTTSLTLNAPIIFTANVGGLYANTVYYIKTLSSPNITVSLSRTNGIAGTVVDVITDANVTTATIYVGSDIWKRITPSSW
jgi:hypothetical protein